jgi:hypothetical protein
MENKRPLDYVWVVAYINRDYIERVEEDLLTKGFGAIRVFIPTTRILKKQFKGKNQYEYVPLLFNYGFFQIPYKQACDAEFLKNLKEKIPAIYAWVQDTLQLVKTKPHLRLDNSGRELPEDEVDEKTKLRILRHDFVPMVAIAKEEEIVELLKVSERASIFSDEIVDKLEIGSFITLRGYPYEGMPAEIVHINKKDKKVKVKLLLETIMAEVMVSFENIFYTVYSNYDEELKETSLEELALRGNRKIDKLFAQISYGDND